MTKNQNLKGRVTLKINNDVSTRGLLLDLKHRSAGSMTDEKTGKLREWIEGDVIVLLPFDSTKGYLQKTLLEPTASARIQAKLADAHWGAVVELTIENRQAVDVEVIMDAFAAFYDD